MVKGASVEESKKKFPAFEDWLKKHGFTPYEMDADYFDETLAEPLMTSLIAGYDPARPIRRADCPSDAKVHRKPVDGGHRLYNIYLLAKKGIKINYIVVEEFCDDEEDFLLKQAYYDKIGISKDRKVAERRMSRNFQMIVDKHPELDSAERIVHYFSEKGWKDQITLDVWLRKTEKKENKNGGPKADKPVVETSEIDQTINNRFQTPEDGTTAKRVECLHCEAVMQLNITKDLEFVKRELLMPGKPLKEVIAAEQKK